MAVGACNLILQKRYLASRSGHCQCDAYWDNTVSKKALDFFCDGRLRGSGVNSGDKAYRLRCLS